MTDLRKLIGNIAILAIVIYAGFFIFVDMVKTLWNLSPITSAGFVIAIFSAIIGGHMSIDKLEGNLRILIFIFVGTILSYAATSLIPNLLNIAFGGDILSALIMLLVIIIIWARGEEIKGRE